MTVITISEFELVISQMELHYFRTRMYVIYLCGCTFSWLWALIVISIWFLENLFRKERRLDWSYTHSFWRKWSFASQLKRKTVKKNKNGTWTSIWFFLCCMNNFRWLSVIRHQPKAKSDSCCESDTTKSDEKLSNSQRLVDSSTVIVEMLLLIEGVKKVSTIECRWWLGILSELIVAIHGTLGWNVSCRKKRSGDCIGISGVATSGNGQISTLHYSKHLAGDVLYGNFIVPSPSFV